MATYLMQMFGVSLLLTLLFEGLVAFLWGVRGKNQFLLVILINVLTNPVAVLIYWLYQVYVADNSIHIQILIEMVVVVVEACVYRSFSEKERFRIDRPILLAIIANALSWGIGRFL